MPNVRLYFHNKFDDLDIANITVSSAAAAYPKNNLQSFHRKKTWRSTDLSSPYVKWDHGQAENSNYLALINHNLTVDGEITITLSDSSDYSSPVYQETHDAWEPLIGFGENGFGEHGFGGYLLDSERAALAPDPILLVHYGASYTARYGKVEFSDAANADGYIEAGRILTGMYWEPAVGFPWGWAITPLDESVLAFSEGGQTWTDIKPKRMEVSFSLPRVKDEERYWQLIDMLRRWGKRKSTLVCLFPAGDPSEKFFTTIYGRFRNIPASVHDFVNVTSAKLNFTEDL